MSVRSKLKLLAKLRNKEYRDAYVEEHVKTSLPYQIRALRDQRRWTQERLANEANTTQTAISRMENPEYGNLSLNSLYKLASAFDVALLVKFVPFSRLLDEFSDVSPEALEVQSFDEEIEDLEEAATASTWTTGLPVRVFSWRTSAPRFRYEPDVDVALTGLTFQSITVDALMRNSVWPDLDDTGDLLFNENPARRPVTTQDVITADSVMLMHKRRVLDGRRNRQRAD